MNNHPLPRTAAVPVEAQELTTSIPLLRALTTEQQHELLREARRIVHAKGHPIFNEGDACQGFYIVLSGLVKIYHLTAEGKEMVLHLIRPGQSFGEAFIFRQGDYPMAAAAVEASESLYIPTPLMLRLIRHNPDLAESVLGALATRLYMFTRKLQAQSLREAPQRLAAYLLHTSRMRGHDPHIQLDISRELLASMLGTARETISRTLSKLADRGAVRVRGKQVHLVDLDILQRIADGQEEL